MKFYKIKIIHVLNTLSDLKLLSALLRENGKLGVGV